MADKTVKVKDCIPRTYVRGSESGWWKKDRPEHGVHCESHEAYDSLPVGFRESLAEMDAHGKIMDRHCSFEATREVEDSPTERREVTRTSRSLRGEPMPIVDRYEEVRGDEKCFHVLLSWSSFECGGKRFECKPETTRPAPAKPRGN